MSVTMKYSEVSGDLYNAIVCNGSSVELSENTKYLKGAEVSLALLSKKIRKGKSIIKVRLSISYSGNVTDFKQCPEWIVLSVKEVEEITLNLEGLTGRILISSQLAMEKLLMEFVHEKYQLRASIDKSSNGPNGYIVSLFATRKDGRRQQFQVNFAEKALEKIAISNAA